jgi:hypothetical protein
MAFRRTALLCAEVVVTTAAVMATISSSVVDAQRKAQTAPETFPQRWARTDTGAAASTVHIRSIARARGRSQGDTER